MRTLIVGAVLGLILVGCGGGSSKPATATHDSPTASTPTSASVTPLPTDFKGGYAHAWGQIKQLGADVAGAINEVKRAQARHQTVSDAHIAFEFARFASRVEPAVIELQALTPPASVARAFKSLAAAAVGMSGALRNFSTDANANRVSAGQRDLASYFGYLVTIDKGATEIYHKLGIK
jgi:hypothetical protein